MTAGKLAAAVLAAVLVVSAAVPAAASPSRARTDCQWLVYSKGHLATFPDWTESQWANNGCLAHLRGKIRCGYVRGGGLVTEYGGWVLPDNKWSRATCPTSHPQAVYLAYQVDWRNGTRTTCIWFPTRSGKCS